ncbi:MAG: hypothetical protein QF719_04000 [Chloroflexota bacterium]|jgi:hypothetical protein|nr:hypothetical protein [Chloroflexota bacterium]
MDRRRLRGGDHRHRLRDLFIYLANRDITHNISEIARVARGVEIGDLTSIPTSKPTMNSTTWARPSTA